MLRRGGADVLGARAGVRRARRGRADATRHRRVAEGRAVRARRRPAARAHAPRGEGGAAPSRRGGRRAARADLPALRRAAAGLTQPEGEPGARGRGRELWRLAETDAIVDAFADRQLLIADGHHRYETTVEYAAGGGSPWLMVVLVSTSDPGLTIFPTHRIAGRFDPSNKLSQAEGGPAARSSRCPATGAAAVVYTRGRSRVAEDGRSSTRSSSSRSSREVGYTADVDEAIAAVDEGDARGGVPAPADADRGGLRGRAARRGDAAEDDVLLSPSSSAASSFHPL